MHFELQLPPRVANGVVRGKDLKVEIVTSVGGKETSNKLWGRPLRTFEVPFPNMKDDNPDLAAIEDLWDTVDGSVHTFNHFDERSNETVRVRFEGKLNLVHVEGPFYRYDTLLLVERRED